MEQWKPVEGYEGIYEVSTQGRVRSHYGTKIHILKKMTNAGKYNGYEMVTLYRDHGKGIKKKVHRLVAEAFIENKDGLPSINHKDENRRNNNVNNLEWCSVSYNSNYGTAPEKKRAAMLRRREAAR